MKPLFKPRTMRIQHIGDAGAGGGYALDVKVTWLTPDQIRLSFARLCDTQEYVTQDYYLTPQELAKIADHINDVLAR